MKKTILVFCFSFLCFSVGYSQAAQAIASADCVETKATYEPASPSALFAGFDTDAGIAMTSFVAECTKLKEAYIWVHEELSGLLGAHIVQGGTYGEVIAIGTVPGREKGKQQVLFPNDIYLQKGAVYYLKLFKGEPATIHGSVAKAAQPTNKIQGYNVYGPVTDDLAHELIFEAWEGDPPDHNLLNEKKQHPAGYEQKVNEALHATIDLWGEEVLASSEGPTYENVKDYLAPLKLMGTAVTESGVYYIPFGRPLNDSGFGPAALHVGDGSQIISQKSAGDKITIYVGAGGLERYGYAEARLEQEGLDGGYYPILQNVYRDADGVTYFQESFSDYVFATTELVSFVQLKIAREHAKVDSVKVVFHFSDDHLSLENNTVKWNNQIRAIVSPGGRLAGANKIVYDIKLGDEDPEIYVARLLHPAGCILSDVNEAVYQAEKKELKAYWDSELAKGAVFDVPEEQVNNAQKNLLIQNLYMGFLYSIGNLYQNWYQPEGNDVARILGEYGFTKQQRAIHEVLLSRPFRRYRTWEMGELLSHAAQYYYISRDTSFIFDNKSKFLQYLDDFEQQMDASEHGVLKAESFSGDIAEQLVYLHHQATAWRGMRDMAYILKSLGDTTNGDTYSALAETLKTRLTTGINEGKTFLADGSLFIPTELFTKTKPTPYPVITETKYGSYWNLCFPYAAASGLLDEALFPGYYQYLKNYGAFLLGMVRFNYYPVPVGSYKSDGLPGYKTTGVDNVYGLNLSRFVHMMDDPDRLALAFYAKLAHGMTRRTFISGEGDTVGPYPDEYYRTFYLSPSSFNNSWFLLMLRLMLIAEKEDEKGVPDKLQLAFSTPRAWLEQGKQINVSAAPTLFGKMDYQIRSDIENGTIHARIAMPDQATSASEITLRFRVPGNKKIKTVKINGAKHKAFHPDNETIDLTGKKGLLQIVAYY